MTEQTFRVSVVRNWRVYAAVALTGAGLLLVFHYANALSYSAEPITATVIDAESRQALEGVNVLVLWDLEDPNGRGGQHWAFEETVTDKEGRFHFPGWGPKPVPRTLGSPAWRLGSEQPVVYLFRSGYPLESVSNPWESWMLGNSTWTGEKLRRSVWTGKTIELRRFSGSEQQYLNQLSIIAGGLPLQDCDWAKIPRLTAALVLERGDRVKFPMTSGLPTIEELEDQAKAVRDCSSPTVVLRPYLK